MVPIGLIARYDLPRAGSVYPPRVSKSRWLDVQCIKSDEDIICGIMLLFDIKEETIDGADASAIFVVDGCVGHGGSIANFPFVFDDTTTT